MAKTLSDDIIKESEQQLKRLATPGMQRLAGEIIEDVGETIDNIGELASTIQIAEDIKSEYAEYFEEMERERSKMNMDMDMDMEL